MKLNWKVRLKNPYFWMGLIAVIIAAIGVEPETFTSWSILWEQIKNFAGNPFLIGCTVVAVIGYVNDPTTAGLGDSKQALLYKKPKKE
ncbi:MAG: phage holin [Clostridiales bacterium]|nr:phage holin [Clostridiales bacterium]